MSLFLALAEILFVGDGRLERTVPALLEAAIKQLGGSASVAVDFVDGAPLQYNLDNPTPTNAQATPPQVEALSDLKKGKTRAVILTEGMPLSKILSWHHPVETVANYAALARVSNPDVRVFLNEGWPSLDSGTVINKEVDEGSDVPWRERIGTEADIWRAIAEKAGQDVLGGPVTLIPVAQALGHLDDEIAAGRVPGIKSIQDLFEDNSTPNGRGAYFITMVELATMTGKSPTGLPARLLRSWPTRDWVVSDEQATIFQNVAWEAVQAFEALPPLSIADQTSATTNVKATDAAPEPTVAEIPPAPIPDVIDMPGVTNPSLFVGLAGVVDWSTEQPFLDLMKTARPWIGHLPGQWGGWGPDDLAKAGALDENGWPLFIPEGLTGIATLILTDMPSDGLGYRGRYVLRHLGNGKLTIEGNATVVSNEPGKVLFYYQPGPGPVIITLNETDPNDPVRNITIVREDRVEAFDKGEIFNPDWLARIKGVQGVRFMDWMQTNNSTQSRFDDRPKPLDYTWAAKGVPLEVMIALCNQLKADPWFNIPHLADDNYVRQFATMVHDGLKKERRAWVEFSNEVWNWQFQQANWAEEQGNKRWGDQYTWVQYYALRASQVAAIWTEVYGPETDSRLVRVIGTHPGYLGLEPQILDAPLVVGEGKPAPAKSFDAYAITGYFSGKLGNESKIATIRSWVEDSVAQAEKAAKDQGLSGDDATAYVAQHRFDAAIVQVAGELRDGHLTGDDEDSLTWNTDYAFPYQAKVAKDHGLQLVMYEGGSHVVGIGNAVDDPLLTDFFAALNYSDEMGQMYIDLMKGWRKVSDAPFNQYFDMGAPSKWGSWGGMRHLGDTNPRWNALASGCDGC